MRLSKSILDLFLYPRNAGSWPTAMPRIISGQAGAPGLGEMVRIQLMLDESGSRIRAVRFKAHGSVYTIAAASWLADQLEQRSPKEADDFTATVITKALNFPLSYQHCATLAIHALQNALQNYPLP